MPEAKTLASSSTDDKRWTKHLRMFLAAHDVNELSAAAVAFQEETLNDGATFSGLSGWFKARWHRQAEESTRRVLERLREIDACARKGGLQPLDCADPPSRGASRARRGR